MACLCTETRISYTNPQGNGAVAPVRYACAEHATAERKRRAAIDKLASTIFPERFPLALPAPALQLTGPVSA